MQGHLVADLPTETYYHRLKMPSGRLKMLPTGRYEMDITIWTFKIQ